MQNVNIVLLTKYYSESLDELFYFLLLHKVNYYSSE